MKSNKILVGRVGYPEILTFGVFIQEQGQQIVAICPSQTCCFHCSRECHLQGNNYIVFKAKRLSWNNLLLSSE